MRGYIPTYFRLKRGNVSRGGPSILGSTVPRAAKYGLMKLTPTDQKKYVPLFATHATFYREREKCKITETAQWTRETPKTRAHSFKQRKHSGQESETRKTASVHHGQVTNLKRLPNDDGRVNRQYHRPLPRGWELIGTSTSQTKRFARRMLMAKMCVKIVCFLLLLLFLCRLL